MRVSCSLFLVALVLCTPLLAEEGTPGLEPVFDRAYLQGEPPEERVRALWQRIREGGEAYLQELGEDEGFNGFYFRGEGWKSLDEPGYGYRYGIDLELFDNGRYEGRRKQARRIVESRTRYLQLLDDMSRRAADEQRHALHSIRMRLKGRWLEARLALLGEQLKKAREELKAGFLTRDAFNDYLLRHTEAELKLASVRESGDTALPKGWLELLNHAENLLPLSAQELVARAYDQDYRLKLQEVFMERAAFQPDWKDNLEARFFIEKRYSELDRQDDVVVGFRTRVPLDRVPDSDSLAVIEKRIYEEQGEAIRLRIRQRIEQQLQSLRQHQAGLRAMLDRLREMEHRIDAERKHAGLVIASLPYTPERELRVLARRKLDLLYEILLERTRVLEYLIDLAGLTRDPYLRSVLAWDWRSSAASPK